MSGDKSIYLSEKHGVNPSIEQCFFCGKDKGLILFGRLPDDKEAPRKVCVGPEPCTDCAEIMEKGVLFISVKDGSSGDNPPRTGRLVGLREEAVKEIIVNEDMLKDLLEKRCCFMHESAFNHVFGDLPEKEFKKEEDSEG